ncbi:unnamed protein product [Parajaminaea phylloscopi]
MAEGQVELDASSQVSASEGGWRPRASTPNGPNPMSPSKRAPSPIGDDAERSRAGNSTDSPPLPDAADAVGLGLDPDVLATPAPAPRQSVPPMSAWKSMPGFEELDESWVNNSQQDQGHSAAAVHLPEPLHREENTNVSSRSGQDIAAAGPEQETSLNDFVPAQSKQGPITSAATETSFYDIPAGSSTDAVQETPKPIIDHTDPTPLERTSFSIREGPQGGSSVPRESDGAEMLQAGPSRPTMRKRSEETSRDSRRQSTVRTDGTISAPESVGDEQSILLRTRQRPRSSSHSRALDRGAADVQTHAPHEREHGNASQIEGDSSSAAAGVTASEGAGATFLHHSDVSELPPILRPAWKAAAPGVADPRTPLGKKGKGRGLIGGDMFTPLKLQTMFKTPTPPDAPPVKDLASRSDRGQPAEATDSPSPQDRQIGGQASDRDSTDKTSTNPNAPRTPPRTQPKHLVPSFANAAFTFRSSFHQHERIGSPFAHIATPRTAQKKRGLSAEAFAHIGQASAPGKMAASGLASSTQALPVRLFAFPNEKALTAGSAESDAQRNIGRSASVDAIDEAADEAPCEPIHPASEVVARDEEIPERKRLRLCEPTDRSHDHTDSRDLSQTHKESTQSDAGCSVQSLSPLRLSVRRSSGPKTADSPSVPGSRQEEDQSPRKIFRWYSAAGQVDREIAQDQTDAIDLRSSSWSDDEHRRDSEVAAQEERLRCVRERRTKSHVRGQDHPRPVSTAAAPPKVVLVDVNGESEELPASAHSRTYSQSSMLPSSSSAQRQSLSSTLVNAPAVEHDSPAAAKTSAVAPPVSSTMGRGHQLQGAIQEVSVETLASTTPREGSFQSTDARISSMEARHGSVSPSLDGTRATNAESSSRATPGGTEWPANSPGGPTHDRKSPSVRNGTPPILRPTYALQHLNSLPKSGSALRNEVIWPDGDDSTSTASLESARTRSLSPPASGQKRSASSPPTIRSVAVTPRRDDPTSVQPPRSILKSGPRDFATPDRTRSSLEPPRSITFADGKALSKKMPDNSPLQARRAGQGSVADDSLIAGSDAKPRPTEVTTQVSSATQRSAVEAADRAARIQELLEQVRQLALGEDEDHRPDQNRKGVASTFLPEREDSWEAPSPTSRYSQRVDLLANLRQSTASSRGGKSVWNFDESAAERTFLTQASFNIAHDRIVEALTDVVPFVPDWEELKKVDLSGRRLESLVRLKEFVPQLQSLHMDHNTVSYLTGLPSSLRILTASSNTLSPIASFGHLHGLETLDISDNGITDLSSLDVLTHLRHLKADGNGISSIAGIAGLEHLHTLSLRRNTMGSLDLLQTSWRRLQDLDVSHNRLSYVASLSSCKHLKALNLSHNDLSRLDLGPKLPKLRELRVSSNLHLERLDVLPARELHTLYADFCALTKIDHLGSLSQLVNLSVRQQFTSKRGGFAWPASQVEGVQRLFLSGNAFSSGLDREMSPTMGSDNALLRWPTRSDLVPKAFSNLVYLELAGCQLETLPVGFSVLFPDLHQLNLDHNLFSRLPAGCFAGLTRLKRASVVGCRLRSTRSLVEAFEGCESLAVLDTRMNPATLGLYPPLMTPSARREAAATKAYVAPTPNQETFRPDVAQRRWQQEQRSERRRETGLYEKSFFHKRHSAPHHRAAQDGANSDDESMGCDIEVTDSSSGGVASRHCSAAFSPTAGFALSDAHFVRTLPTSFSLSRALHRGTLGLVCPALVWLDGLVLGQDEVSRAEKILLQDEEEFASPTKSERRRRRKADTTGPRK